MTITEPTNAIDQRWPLAALLDACANSPVTVLAARLGVSTRTIWRWHHRGLTDTQADHVAVTLGYHPANIWPHWYTTKPPVRLTAPKTERRDR